MNDSNASASTAAAASAAPSILDEGVRSLLARFANERRFVAWYPAPKGGTTKVDKIPFDPATGGNSDAQDASTWLTGNEAAHYAARGVRIGVVLDQNPGIFCLDLDAALLPDGSGWSPFAKEVLARFPGACVEVSHSGKGLHLFGWCSTIPEHRTRRDGVPIEIYTRSRFIAFGSQMSGEIWLDHTAALQALIAEYLPEPVSNRDAEWSTEAYPGWRDAGTDEQILAALMNRASAHAVFGNGASFGDLWAGDTDALARAYPDSTGRNAYNASSADLALANHIAHAVGFNCERTLRLMWQSALRRDKWAREKYLRDTILSAVAGKIPKPADVPAAPAADAPHVGLIDRTDAGNAALLIQLADGTLRYVAETKQWLRWTGARWQLDEHEVFVTTYALNVARHYLDYAAQLDREVRIVDAEATRKWAAKCRSKGSIDNMVALARKTGGVPINVAELDRDPWLLGVENGVVDLRTGELRPDARDELVTKRCRLAYDPLAHAARWEQFIAEITGAPSGLSYVPRPELARYLQKALGYSITGSTKEQKFFLAIGAGSNGKNVVFDAVKRVLGDYARTLTAEALMASDRAADAERPTATAATLAGARFVLSSETKDGQTLDVGALKNHTGDEEMTARRMRENPFTFTITHHLWLMTNYRPALAHVDAAIRGRLHLIPFERRWNRPSESERDLSLPDGDKDLATTLAGEAPGVLTWLVRGALLYQSEGLQPPAAVASLTREYVQEQDHMGTWLATMRRCAPRDGTLASELLVAFHHWCAGEGAPLKPSTQKAFSIALTNRGIEKQPTERGMNYGIVR